MRRFLALIMLAFAPALAIPAAAQEVPVRVGRVAYIDGEAAVYQDPEIGWEKAYVNSPFTTENSVWTEPDSRAELRVSGMAIRLDEATQLDVPLLDEDQLEAFVVRGTVAVRIRHMFEGDRLDFASPHGRFRLLGEGRYRIDVDPETDETLFTVFRGAASLRSSAGDVRLAGGEAVRIYGGPRPSFTRERARNDAFDRWTLARDERWIERRSTRYVSTYMTGYEDLDAYGEWIEEPEYGVLWYPTRVARDWAPYRYGRWTWVRPWGWTWVDDAPWGYAPFHYGRWVYVRDRWAWHPGHRHERPVWAPALVAWVGGSNFSVRLSSGAAPVVGWYPLAPWERYDPWYRVSPRYESRVNIIVRDRPPRSWQGRRDWRTWNREHGATIVPRARFTTDRPIAQARINVAPDVIRQAPVAEAAQVLPQPTREMRRTEWQRKPRGGDAVPGGQASGGAAPAGRPSAGAPMQRGERAAARDANPLTRPQFVKPEAAPAPAPATAPPSAAARGRPDNALTRPAPGAFAPGRDVREEAHERRDQRQDAREQGREERRERREQRQELRQGGREQQVREAQERAQREANERSRGAQEQEQLRQQREAQEAQQRAQREAQERARQELQPRQMREAQERNRQAQEARQRAQREAEERARQGQEQQQLREQREAQERGQRENERARQAQEAQRQQREAQEQQQLRQQREAQERGQREANERARQAREAQRQQREAQEAQRQQRQAQERAQREAGERARQAQEAQQRAQREANERAQRAAPQAQPQGRGQPERGQPDRGQPQERGRPDRPEKEKEKEDEQPGKGRGRDR